MVVVYKLYRRFVNYTCWQAIITHVEKNEYGDETNRGMPLSILGGKIGTARDVGNFAAGFFAASLGFTGKTTRKAFDFFQNITTPGCTTGEPPVSWWAQQLGYDYGRAARFANRVCLPNIYNAYR